MLLVELVGAFAALYPFSAWAYATARRRRHAQLVEAQIRMLRERALSPFAYAPLDRENPAHAAAVARLDDLAALTAEATDAGLIVLGDEFTPQAPAMPTRWFVTEDGQIAGYFAAGRVGERRIPMIALSTSAADWGRVTTRADVAVPSLARPPAHTRQAVARTASLRDVLARHRAFVGELRGAEIRTMDDARREFERVRDVTRAWRELQAPADLLRADLQSLLGAQYAKYGPGLAAKLAATLPTARVVAERR